MAKVAGALQQSTGVMKAMQQVVKMPVVAEACRTMAQEMARAGIIQEMTDDMFEMLEPDDMEDEVEEEVNKVVMDILGEVPEAADTPLPDPQGEAKQDAAPAEAAGVSEMEARLAALA